MSKIAGIAKAALLCGMSVLTGCTGDGPPSGDPLASVKMGMRGWEAKPGIAFSADETALWAQQVLSGFSVTTSKSGIPASLSELAVMGGCEFRAPISGEIVGNVHIGTAAMKGPVYAWNAADIQERAGKFIERYKDYGEKAQLSFEDGDRFSVIDVAVTETAGPVYLVLQSEAGSPIWNIHAAEGVQIAHVAVISRERAGVANLDPEIPVQIMDGKAASRCKAAPMRKPDERWRFIAAAREQGTDVDDIVQKNEDGHAAYDRWFSKRFGIGSEADVIGADVAGQVLVGPLPVSADARARFRPIEGAAIAVTPSDNIMAADEAAYTARHNEQLMEIATSAAGGDLKAIAPKKAKKVPMI